MEEMYLNQVIWWNQFQIANLTIHSIGDCDFIHSSDTYEHFNPFLWFRGYKNKVEVLHSSSPKIIPKYQCGEIKPPPAVRIKDLSVDIHSIFEPVIDVNASGIVINIVSDKDVIPITPKITVPFTVIKVGDWTLNEIFDLIPPPPEKEGLYPRLGIVNITDVRILSGSTKDGFTALNETTVPDEFFFPLYELTKLAGKNGTDRMFISNIITKSVGMVLHQNVFGEQGFGSKAMEQFLSNLQRSTEFMQEMMDVIHLRLHELTRIIDDGKDKAGKALEDFIQKIEHDWQALHNDEGPIYKISNEANNVWNGVGQNISKAGNSVLIAVEAIERKLKNSKGNGILPHVNKEMQDKWNKIKTTVKTTEDYLHIQARIVEDALEQTLNEAAKDVHGGVIKAKEFFKIVLQSKSKEENEL